MTSCRDPHLQCSIEGSCGNRQLTRKGGARCGVMLEPNGWFDPSPCVQQTVEIIVNPGRFMLGEWITSFRSIEVRNGTPGPVSAFLCPARPQCRITCAPRPQCHGIAPTRLRASEPGSRPSRCAKTVELRHTQDLTMGAPDRPPCPSRRSPRSAIGCAYGPCCRSGLDRYPPQHGASREAA